MPEATCKQHYELLREVKVKGCSFSCLLIQNETVSISLIIIPILHKLGVAFI